MKKYNKRKNYSGTSNYLDFLTAFRKFFTNGEDVIPIIDEFNFYVPGVYGTPYVDLFRMYDEAMDEIHGGGKLKELIDDRTVGVINETIYKQGNGSLLMALENIRVVLENKRKNYNVGLNPISDVYTESLKPVVNVLPDSNPDVLPGGLGGPGGGNQSDVIVNSQQPKPKKKKTNILKKYFGFLSYKNKKKKI